MNQRMDGTMMTIEKGVALAAGAAALALMGTVAVASLPVLAGLAVAVLLFAGLGYVAFSAQCARFDAANRLVYRPVYVRSRSVHRRVSSVED